MLRQNITLGLTPIENDLLEVLRAKGITIISIFRRGMELYERELIAADPEAHPMNKKLDK